jgi:transposase-like protein
MDMPLNISRTGTIRQRFAQPQQPKASLPLNAAPAHHPNFANLAPAGTRVLHSIGLQIRCLPRRPAFAYSTLAWYAPQRMLRRSGVSIRTPPRLSKIKPPERCPHCNSKRLIKKGTRKKKLEDVPIYRCRSCGRTLSTGPRAIRNKTYPMPEILEAFTLYDRGNTREATADKISSHSTATASRLRQSLGGSRSTRRSPPTAAFASAAGGCSARRNRFARTSSTIAKSTNSHTMARSSRSSETARWTTSARPGRVRARAFRHSPNFWNQFRKHVRTIFSKIRMVIGARNSRRIFSRSTS